MRKLFNLFKKKSAPETTKALETDKRKPAEYWDIDGKRFATAEKMIVKTQTIDETRRIYGWTLEVRMQWNNNNTQTHTTDWFTYHNHRIYQSQSSAIRALLSVNKHNYYFDARIMPLYVMDNTEFRDYKIDKLLIPETNKDKFEIKAWKIKYDCEVKLKGIYNPQKYKKGTIFIRLENGSVQQAATKNEKTRWAFRFELEELLENDLLEEFSIENEKWIHPHLCKELKTKFKNK